MTSEIADIVYHHPGVIGGEAEIAQLPKPMLPHSAYRQHVPLARGIVAEYQKRAIIYFTDPLPESGMR